MIAIGLILIAFGLALLVWYLALRVQHIDVAFDECRSPKTCGVCHVCQRQQPCSLHPILTNEGK